MNSRRSYLETLNAGRQRRTHSSLEQLNRSLETLEQRIGRAPERQPERRDFAERDPLPPIETGRMDTGRGDTGRGDIGRGDIGRGDIGRWDSPVRRDEASYEARGPRTRSPEPEQTYRTLARDFERVRTQEDSVAAAARIAGELKGIREEIRQQMTSGLKHEFDSLRREIERAHSAAPDAVTGAELTAEFDRISDSIRSLSDKTDDKGIKLLRLELEQVRGALDSLAREDTVRSVDRRWDEFDRRFSEFEDRLSADQRERAAPDPAIDALNQRLEQISLAVNSLPESLSLRSLEEKVRTLAGAVDHFSRQQEARRDAPFDLIEERLDEISRAIVASASAAAAPHFDPEPFERVEARIASLARQIEELVEDRPTAQVVDRLNLLSQRVDEIAAAGKVPEAAIERLARQIATVADKLDQGAAAPDMEQIFRGIEQRFDMLSDFFDRRQGDAIEHGQALFRDLELRLEALASRLDERNAEPPFDSRGIMDAIADGQAGFRDLERRLDSLANRLDDQHSETGRDTAGLMNAIAHGQAGFRDLERRLDSLATRLDDRHSDDGPGSAELMSAIELGQATFRDLERRLDGLAAQLDDRNADVGPATADIMNAIDVRFEELARRLESRPASGPSERTISQIQARLEDISVRLERSSAQIAAVDPGIIRNLEAQVADISRHLAGPNAAMREFEDISPRLDEIEKSLARNRDTILETARQAAESAVRSFSATTTDAPAVTALNKDLKSLEDLTRRSDERNTKTFEAIHDTLLKIVERLGSLEEYRAEVAAFAEPRKMALRDAPSIAPDDAHLPDEPPVRQSPAQPRPAAVRRSPAEAAAEAASAAAGIDAKAEPEGRVRTMLGGLSRAFSGRKEPEPAKTDPSLPGMAPEAPTVDLDQPLDPKAANRPLEPGSGMPDLNAIMRRVRDERGPSSRGNDADAAKSDFIAAARRAAQAAAAAAEVSKRSPDAGGTGRNLKIGELFRSKRKPILIAATVILIALAGLQLGRAFFRDNADVAMSGPQPAPLAELDGTGTSAADVASTLPVAEAPAARSVDAAPAGVAHEPAQPVPAAADADTDTDIPMAAAGDEPAMDSAEPATDHDTQTAALPTAAPAMSTEPAAATMPEPATPAQPQAAVPAQTIPDDAGPLPLREAAQGGDPKAMFEIGSRYAEGRGTKSDMAAAATYYEKSAELGLAPAQYRIGNFYEKGIGVERDIAKAKTWYQMAAEQGNASAMHNLAVLFAMGADGTADNDSAARWFEKAAELGVKDSQFNLGILTAKGVGVQQNLEESYKWFAIVAKTGDRDAATKRDEIANALRPEQLQRARAAAELWKAKPVDAEANTVPIPDAWRESDAKTASIDMKQAVRNIQAILNKNGYDAGSADGVMGQKTKLAIAAFQKANGMKATGDIDEALVRKLLEKK